MDDAGGFFVAWLQREPDFFPLTVQVRAFDAMGQPRGPQFNPPGGSSTNSHFDINIAATPDGSGAILTRVSGHDNGEDTAFYQVSTSDVLGIGYVENSDGEPKVAMFPDGSFVVGSMTWSYRFGPSRYGGFVQRFDASGAPVSDGVPVGASLPGTAFDNNIRLVSVDPLPDAGFLAGFSQEWTGVVTTYVQRFDATGVAIEGPVALDVGPARAHRIGTDATGAAVLAYIQTPASTSDSGAVHFLRLTSTSSVLDGMELFVTGTEGNDHIIVERVRDRLWVNVNGIVEGFNAAEVQFLSISGLGGDDDIDNNTALPATIHGGDGADTLWGGTGPDRIRGFGGDDVLRGGDGNDEVLGDSGSDSLNGGDGNDDLSGDIGEDTLYGAVGNDVLRGHRGSDRLYGEAGDDTLDGGAGGDYLEGGAGHDALIGGGEADALFGLAGNDRLFSAGDGFRDTVRGGPGDDSADADEADDVLGVELP